MFEVTNVEEKAVNGLVGIYHSLRASAENVARVLYYDYPISAPSSKSVLSVAKSLFKPNKKLSLTKKELVELLEVLTILQPAFEECMPLIVDGKLYFKFRTFDGRENSNIYKIGEAESGYDLISCFQSLEENMSKILDTPEVSKVVTNHLSYPYCACLSKQTLGISALHKTYIKELKGAFKTISETPAASEAPETATVSKQRKAIRKNFSKKGKKIRRLPCMK